VPEVWLTALENSLPGGWMRGAGVWSYGVTNLVHIVGVATLFGAVLVLDLRLLGLWRRVPLASIEIPTLPLASAGFCLAASSGLALLTTNATDYVGNPFLVVKFVAIALGLANVAVAQALPAWRQRHEREGLRRGQLAVIGGVSLVCWSAALGAGRMIGYW
jgi:hypothetical protein